MDPKLKILFISRYKENFDKHISPIVLNQGESLVKLGHSVDYYIISDNTIWGYLHSMHKLRKKLQTSKYDIIHAHYSITAIFASIMLFPRKIAVSLMGSDTSRKGLMNLIIKFFILFIWDIVIVKSARMKACYNLSKIKIIPNGVDFDRFRPIDKFVAKKKVGFDPMKKNVVFIADKTRQEKNVRLAREAIIELNNPSLVLHELYPINHKLIPYYLNASDVVLLTSIHEGSPNIIKEAMACNIPVVSTDVGDVKQNIGNTAGCFITSFEPYDVMSKLELALQFDGRTKGRKDLKHLKSNILSQKLVDIYLKKGTEITHS